MEIKTKRLHLVPLGMAYLESAHRYMSALENTRYMVYMPKQDEAETQAFMTQITKEWGKENPDFYELAVLLDGQHIGSVSMYLNADKTVGEVGWIIDKSYWGQGYGAEAAEGMIEYFQGVKGIKHFIAHCDSENVASQKVMRKLGFELVDEYGGRKNRCSEEERMEQLFELNC